MKTFIAAAALAVATPAAAQPAAAPAPHAGHADHAQNGQSQGHAQGEHRGQGEHGPRRECPCCEPGADGRRPACCERMHRQHGAEEDRGGHDDHDNH